MGVISSVCGPLNGSCRAEGEERITGADIICYCHVDLASGLRYCGPVQYECQVAVPAHMLRQDARTDPTLIGTHVQLGRDKLRAYRDLRHILTHSHRKSHTPTDSCTESDKRGHFSSFQVNSEEGVHNASCTFCVHLKYAFVHALSIYAHA